MAIYCEAYGSFCEASEKIATQGFLLKSGERVVPNPFVAVRDTAVRTMLDLAPELGLSPSVSHMTWPAKEARPATKDA